MNEPIISFHSVCKAYGDVQALNDLSFSVPSRGCWGLLGPNGAGKTTALRALLNIARIDSGHITSQARHIGYLPQQPALFGWMTAEENLLFVARAVGLTGVQATDQMNMWLQRLDLTTAKKRRVRGFSGGMKQRLGLAAAMIQDPDVLVLDEPVSALDPVGRHHVLQLIADLKRDRCVIMSTHILDDAQRVCDDVVIMHHGTAVMEERMSVLRDDLTPRYHIELGAKEDTVQSVARKLAEQQWISHVTAEGALVTCLLTEGPSDMQRLLAFLGSLDATDIIRVEKSQVSLEDIFLQVVNHK